MPVWTDENDPHIDIFYRWLMRKHPSERLLTECSHKYSATAPRRSAVIAASVYFFPSILAR